MKDIRLLPIVLFAVSALLVLKVLGLVTGHGSFAVGPTPAVAAGGGEGGGEGHGEAAAPSPQQQFDDPALLGPPIDLASEAEELAKKAKSSSHGGDGKAAAGDHGEAAPAEGDAKAAADGHGEAAPADGHGEAAAADGHGEAAPADGHGGAAPADGHGDAAADGHAAPADGHAAPADGKAEAGHGEAAAAGGHDAAAGGHGADGETPSNVSTVRPEEFQPTKSQAELDILKSLSERRSSLEQREEDINLRLKLLEAAESRLQKRMEEIQTLQSSLAKTDPADAAKPAEQVKGLATMYENMKPKAAAAVFDELDLSILIDLSRAMNPRKMAAVLAVMDPEKAGALTAALASGAGAPPPAQAQSADAMAPAPAGSDALPKIMPANGTQ